MNTTQHKQVVVNNDSIRAIRKLEGSKVKANAFAIDASDLIKACMKASK